MNGTPVVIAVLDENRNVTHRYDRVRFSRLRYPGGHIVEVPIALRK